VVLPRPDPSHYAEFGRYSPPDISLGFESWRSSRLKVYDPLSHFFTLKPRRLEDGFWLLR
jgi:hypothetical protein